MEADYFLFIRGICQDFEYPWDPQSCLYLDKTPSYMEMALSKTFLDKLITASGLDNSKVFIQKLISKHGIFRQYFNKAPFKRDPLSFFDFNKLGSKK
jgi:hypothetical protein